MQVMEVSVASLSKHFKNNSEIYANKESAKLTGILDAFSPLYASLAKLVRHRPFKAGIFLGSSPRRRTRGYPPHRNNSTFALFKKRLTLQKFYRFNLLPDFCKVLPLLEWPLKSNIFRGFLFLSKLFNLTLFIYLNF